MACAHSTDFEPSAFWTRARIGYHARSLAKNRRVPQGLGDWQDNVLFFSTKASPAG
jgi:hypothetical protein